MAAGPITQVSDVIVPEVFTPYIQQLTEEKARLVQSGVITRSALLDTLLDGGGLTFNVPSFRDLDNDEDRVATDAASTIYGTHVAEATPQKIETSQEIAVRLNRNQSWSSADLTADLAGSDPMGAIANRVAFYWTRRLQALFVATMVGVFNDNEAAPSGSDTHTQNDMTNDISGTFSDGVTTFSAEAFLDAAVTMGDSQEDLVAVMVHSVVFNRMQKNNLIDFIPDARGEIQIPTFLGREVIVDDGLPNNVAGGLTAGDYETWLFGRTSMALGVGTPKVPTAVTRHEDAGNGGGQEVLFNRVKWTLHPVGHAFIAGTIASGGPINGSLSSPVSNTITHADSWSRRFPERKQIKIARLITTEA
ncbi:MAG: hypothetical protein V3W44_10100 [Dehalococcoidales bacterium]